MKTQEIKRLLGSTDMYLIDLLQKGYFDKKLSVLDVGCGSGRNLWMLAELGHSCLGIDKDPLVISSLALAIANEKSDRIESRVGTLGELAKEGANFDFIICNAVLHFANSQENFNDMIKDLLALAKNGGVVFCRLVTSHTLDMSPHQLGKTQMLMDETQRFVVDFYWLIEIFLPSHGVTFLEIPKTVNVGDLRSMTTLVFRAK